MSNPQLENGYTRIANEILEVLAVTELNGTQRRILDVVIRQTYGYQRKSHELSISFIAQATSINHKQIQRELSKLIDREILLVIKEATFNKSREIQLNKNYKRWLNSGEGANKLPPPKLDTHTGSELEVSRGSELEVQIKKERKLKEKSAYDDFIKELLPFYPGIKSKSVRDKKLPNIIKEYGKDKVIACVKNYAKSVQGVEQKFILHESTFWNTRYIDFMVEAKEETKRQPLKMVYREL